MNEFTIGLIGWLAGAAIWFWWVRRYDRFEPESIRALLCVGVFGGLASGVAAGIGNELMAKALGLTNGVADIVTGTGFSAGTAFALALFVGFNEEVLKAVAAVVLTHFFGDLDEPVDAPLYAMMTALGFAVVENLDYATQFGAGVLLPRYVLATAVHVVLALLWGAAWAKGRFLMPRVPRWIVMAPAIVVAALLHGAWDYASFTKSSPGVLLGLVGLATLAVWAHGTKRAIAMESPFVAEGVCPQCGATGGQRAKFCRQCGYALYGVFFVQCGDCKGRMPAHAAFCPRCGVARA
jgi:RsiW-degrading membrane proteinase PrsW (M82 family)